MGSAASLHGVYAECSRLILHKQDAPINRITVHGLGIAKSVFPVRSNDPDASVFVWRVFGSYSYLSELPPSIRISLPVMNSDASLARKVANADNSSTFPKRPVGCLALHAFNAASGSGID